VNIRCIVALSSEILHQLLLWSAISMKWFRKKLNSDHKPLEMHWWKGVETLKGLYKYSLAEMAHNVTAFVSFTPFESSHDECQVCTVSFFLLLCFNIKWKGAVSHYYPHMCWSPPEMKGRKWSRHVLNFDVVPEVFSGLCTGVWEFLEKRRHIKASHKSPRESLKQALQTLCW